MGDLTGGQLGMVVAVHNEGQRRGVAAAEERAARAEGQVVTVALG